MTVALVLQPELAFRQPTLFDRRSVIADSVLLPKGAFRVADITIRNLDDALMQRLRRRAARHGRSMEDEVRKILAAAVADGHRSGSNLAESMRRRFAEVGGVDLPLPARAPLRDPPRFKP